LRRARCPQKSGRGGPKLTFDRLGWARPPSATYRVTQRRATGQRRVAGAGLEDRRLARAAACLARSPSSHSFITWQNENAHERPRANRQRFRVRYGTAHTRSRIRPLDTPRIRTAGRVGCARQRSARESRSAHSDPAYGRPACGTSTVVVNSIDNVASVGKAITNYLGSAADVTSTQATTQAQLAPLNSVRTISTYTLIGAVIGAALILLLSMLMIVRERRREVGVLKALGAPNRSIITQFISESTTFTVLGAIVGFIGGVAISSPITSALISAKGGSATTNTGGFVRNFGGAGGFTGGGSGFTPPAGAAAGGGGLRFGGVSNTLTQIHTSAGWSTLVFALLAAIVIAAIGSTVATATIVRIRPAEVLRSE